MSKQAVFNVYRGSQEGGDFQEFTVPVEEGMVVLDAMHYVQGFLCPDLAVRWNCKAAKCGSCSAEINGKPGLMCKTRIDDLPIESPVSVQPIKSFPIIKDLVTDVSWNFEMNKKITPFTPDNEDVSSWRYYQEDVDRVQEFRKCIECFLCQDVCHVIRNHEQKPKFVGPRFMVRLASLEMHPMDRVDRLPFIKEEAGIGLCNITKCCTEVCPEDIHITDNAIIPLKERVVDEYYDPVVGLLRGIGILPKRNKKKP
ncbi:MAG: succinate dehydrogenase/fumarate reductase iron-sulfur subunit [Cyanobacteria bacterium]|nr:succinate dehydrogenase/fumarate reductase iron-sulfur subunit [Cyanobacteriota bacterium]